MSCVRNLYYPDPFYINGRLVTSEFFDSETGAPCAGVGGGNSGGNSGGGGTTGQNPNVLITGGGVTANTSTLDKLLATLLSGFALVQHAPYVPTGIQPQQQPIIYTGGGVSGLGNVPATNTGGKIQQFIEENTGAVLVGGAFLVALMMRPPISRAR